MRIFHRGDAEGAEKKFIYKKLCALCVSAVSESLVKTATPS